jgi:FHA domain
VATCPSGHQSASDDFCDVCGVLIGAAPSLGPGLDPDAGPAGSGVAGGTVAGATVAEPTPWPAEPCPRCGAARGGQFCEVCGYNFALAASGVGQPPPSAAVPAAPVPDVQPAGAGVPDARATGVQATGAAPAPHAQVTYDPWPDVSVPAGPVPGAPGPAAPPTARPGPAPGAVWAAVVTADRAYYDSVLAAGGPDAAGIEFPAYYPQRRFPLDRAEVRIGRHSASSGITPEIDLAVPPADPGISRLHAVLLRDANGDWGIIDPGSANGTLLNGAELVPGQLVPVRDGDRIHLGAWTELRLTRGA